MSDRDWADLLNHATRIEIVAAVIEECAQKLEWLMDQEDIDVAKWPAAIRTIRGLNVGDRERNRIIEECALIAEQYDSAAYVADAIRALKDQRL